MNDARQQTQECEDEMTKTVWNDLVEWVEQHHGGEIHSALTLDQRPSQPRGIFAVRSIVKGETLIRLPASCVLSGASISLKEGAQPVSSWLKCLGAYFQGQKDDKWLPYRNSLPAEYETIFQWTNEQIVEFLAGTTIGEMALADRKEDTLRKRYQTAVRPFLRNLDLPIGSMESDEISEAEMHTFLEACMCISTRGFHLNASSDSSDVGDRHSEYNGPFLLPVIDLLNHDANRKCTTLQRDAVTGAFCMIAEKDIDPGVEILHSYGDSLTAAQLLQTFGFVPPSRLEAYQSEHTPNTFLTPAVLHKNKHLLAACKAVKLSSYPNEIKEWVTTSTVGDVWDVENIPNRPLSDDDAPDVWLISNDYPVLSDELITFVVLQFLPEEVTEEIIGSDGKISSWLDRTILEDVYLGCLVYTAILQALDLKKTEYVPLTGTYKSLVALQRDISMLEDLTKTGLKNLTILRKTWGLSVRIEEQLSLKVFEQEIIGLKESLKGDTSLPPPAKRSKTRF
jgi:hypothetical protein